MDQALEQDLYDNGVGPDLIANDGLYSRYFTQFDGQTRYLLRCQVEGTDETDVNGGFVVTKRDQDEGLAYPISGAVPPCCGSNAFPDNFEAKKTGIFEREVSGGSIKVRYSIFPQFILSHFITSISST
jgi:hypothetical protein